MQFRVPQNIAMEDRIVGPLSPIQFGIVVIGGGIAFFAYSAQILPSPLNIMVAVILALITIVLAVGKFNDQPMYKFIKFLVLYMAKPKIRIWHKEGGEVALVKPDQPKPEAERRHLPKVVSHADIAQLAQVLDSRGSQGVLPQVKTPVEAGKPQEKL